MLVTILGSVSPYTTLNRNCPGVLISHAGENIMLDCGSGSTRRLSFPEDLKNFHVFVSHFHRDHYNDIYNLQYASYVFNKQNLLDEPIEIYLPSKPQCYFEDVIGEKIAYAKYHKLKDNPYGVQLKNFKVTYCLTGHDVESYAFKVQSANKTVVYTSDITFDSSDDIIEFSKNADLLICESSFLEKHNYSKSGPHITAKQAGTIAKKANVKKLILTHFWPAENPLDYVEEAKTVFKNVSHAEEGQTIFLF